ncbi:tripartite tricarboxylate transporter substrate binding protein [Bradyrhizobium manausense]|uniref:Bug family tripartite tricarboxylate transporter substrate binding protein n=1 Tax=Bradyrhizobium TaxID=374 RepID=UPI001BA46603|nr:MULTISPECIES: tripartite tricarboxylate transporter substrate binding protein [Bradyrhizobium]MBR0831135.1 tripartite tricarboxylate transporter substrate binding protein [Bradyrhizobium manausense]UVO29168.1 tripartite tricarboxylate transporter substrate binding protein [Bradyrhizobium arachidis]
MIVRIRDIVRIVVLLAIATSASAQAPNYPRAPVKLITQGAAASGPDVVARVVFDELGRKWKQQIVVLNATGAAGSNAAKQAVQAQADGYTLYLPTGAAFIVMPEMFPNLKIDMLNDFVPVGLVAELPFVIAVSPELNVSSLAELVEFSKARPGTLNFAANARGTLPHLTAERFRIQSGADLTYIPYPGASAGLQDLMGGRISVIVEGLGTLLGAIQNGSLRPLAVTSSRRLPEFPEIPTVAEMLPGFTATGWFALLAPRGTPHDIVEKVNHDLNDTLNSPAVKEKLQSMGTMVRPMSLDDTAMFLRSEQQVWRPVAKQIGIGSSN